MSNIFLSSTCFEPEGSSSGRQLYMQLQYGRFYTHRYKQYTRYWTAYILVHNRLPEDEPSGSKHVEDINN